jgi:hypothetical protein
MSHELYDKEGYLKKRGGKITSRDTKRYFLLSKDKISYKMKKDSFDIRGTYDLDPGCKLTDVVEEKAGSIKGKRSYYFWIVWPHSKNNKDNNTNDTNIIKDNNGDESEPEEHDNDDENIRQKNLKSIVQLEEKNHNIQLKKVEDQLKKHHAHDQHVNLGAKLGAAGIY